MKWKPFFSHLLQSRAAVLQATTPHSKRHSTPLLQPDFYMASSQANTHTTANSVQQTPHPVPQAVSSPAQDEVTAPSQQSESQPSEPVASVQGGQLQPKFEGQQVSIPNSQSECQPEVPSVAATLQATTAQDRASPVSSTPNSKNPSVRPPQPFALPLIRSKTGRIILPSSMKPSKLRHHNDLIPESNSLYLYVSFYSCLYIFFFFLQLVRASIHSWL